MTHSAISHPIKNTLCFALRQLGVFGLEGGEFLSTAFLHSQVPKRSSARRRPADLDAAPIRVHIVPIDCWPNDLGRFASSLTGAHVSDPFSKIDQPTKVPILGA